MVVMQRICLEVHIGFAVIRVHTIWGECISGSSETASALEALLCPSQAWQALVADWQPRSCRAFRAVHQHLLSWQAGSSAHGEDSGADALHSHNRCQEDGLHRGGQGIAGAGLVDLTAKQAQQMPRPSSAPVRGLPFQCQSRSVPISECTPSL